MRNDSRLTTIPGPSGALEIEVDQPMAPAEDRARVVVICHPHPQFGGTMNNKVVTTLARAAVDVGWHAVRFNFRGVGASDGTYDHGDGEFDDAQAVLTWATRRWPAHRPALAGFSFGAWVAVRVALQTPVSRLLTVAPPVNRFDGFPDHAPDCPWWLIQGMADEVVDAERVVAWAAQFVPPVNVITVPDASHFFHGQLKILRDLARRFYQDEG
jgi:hypothetical protein